MENANDKNDVTGIVGNPKRYITNRPKESLLEQIQLSMLALMDEMGDDVTEIMQTELSGPVDVPISTYRDNFPNLDVFLYWCKREIIDGIADTVAHLDEYNDRAKASGEKSLTSSQIVFRLLLWHNQHKTATEFALRRFNLFFWAEALLPVSALLVKCPNYFKENDRQYAFHRFTSLYVADINEWMRNGFGTEHIELCRRWILSHLSNINI